MKWRKAIGVAVAGMMGVVLTECEPAPAVMGRPGMKYVTTAPSAFAQMSAAELRDVLADLARGHSQKKQLAMWVALPLVGKPVGPAFKGFYVSMGEKHDALLKELEAWAHGHDVDLTFAYTDDTAGRALKIMEARQEKLVRGDSQADFERDMLMQMYMDYENQISEIEALLPRVKEAGLKGYLEKSLKVHEEGSAEILRLLRRFKFGG